MEEVNIPKTDQTVLKSLYDQAQEADADYAHMSIPNAFHQEGVTAVMSIYRGAVPSHMVLDQLYAWAEENDKQDVVEMINALEAGHVGKAVN